MRLLLVVFLTGVAASILIDLKTAFQAVLLLSAFLIAIYYFGRVRVASSPARLRLMAICFCIAFTFGLAWGHLREKRGIPAQTFTGRVTAATAPTEYGSVTSVRPEGLPEKIRVYTPRYPEFSYGDIVEVTLKNNSDSDRTYHVGSIKLIQHDPGLITAPLLDVRTAFTNSLSGIAPDPYASFIAGTIIGGSGSLPESMRESFTRTGISHVLAASGYNFTLLILFLAYFLRATSFRVQTAVSLVFIPAFAVVAGASAPVLRAGLMGALGFLAVLVGRVESGQSALLWAAVIMTIFAPQLITQNLGWQLSFAATAGLIYIAPVLEKILRLDELEEKKSLYNKIKSSVLSAFVVTLSAYVATLPLLAFAFGRISTVALAANVLVGSFIPLIMISGLAAGIAAFFWMPLGQLLVLPACLASEYIFAVSRFFSGLSYAQIDMMLGKSLAVALYAGVILGTAFLRSRLLIHSHQSV